LKTALEQFGKAAFVTRSPTLLAELGARTIAFDLCGS
jgi:hypothetical protein